MAVLDYQPVLPSRPRPSAMTWAAAAIVASGCLTAFGWVGFSFIHFMRMTPGPVAVVAAVLIAICPILPLAGILVLESYAILFRSARASEVIATLFCIPALAVIPPIIETFLKAGGVPGISSGAADWRTAGVLLASGGISGFVGVVHWMWDDQLSSSRPDMEWPVKIDGSVESPPPHNGT